MAARISAVLASFFSCCTFHLVRVRGRGRVRVRARVRVRVRVGVRVRARVRVPRRTAHGLSPPQPPYYLLLTSYYLPLTTY